MRILLAVSFIYLSQGCGSAGGRHISDEPASALSAANTQPHGGSVHSKDGWKGVVQVFLEQSAPNRLVETMMNVSKTWNDAIGRDVLVYEGRKEVKRAGSLYDSLDDGITVVYYEQSWAKTTEKSASTLATTIWENDSRNEEAIVSGDIILNAETYTFQDSTKPTIDIRHQAYLVDGETVLLHEAGHLLGLDHISEDDDPDSVMHTHTFIGADVYKRTLSEGDIATIQSIYSNNR